MLQNVCNVGPICILNHNARGKGKNESTQLKLPYGNGCQIRKEIKVDSLGYLESEKSNNITLDIGGNEDLFKIHS